LVTGKILKQLSSQSGSKINEKELLKQKSLKEEK